MSAANKMGRKNKKQKHKNPNPAKRESAAELCVTVESKGCDDSQQGTSVDEPSSSNEAAPNTQANDPEQAENSGLQGSVNFYRIITLIVDLGTDVLLKIFYFYKPKKEVKEYFVTLKSQFEDMKKKGILKKIQYDKLVVPDPNPYDYDISLLVTLLRNVFPNISPPSNGWDKDPADNDVSLSADLLRLRNIRNGIVGHKSKAQLNETKFKDLWLQITKILKRIAQLISEEERSTMENKMDELKLKVLDVTDREERLLNVLKTWFDDDKNKILDHLESLQLKVGELAQNSEMQSLKQEVCSASQNIENILFGGLNRQLEDSINIITRLDHLQHDNIGIKMQLEALQHCVRTTGNFNPLSDGFPDEQCQSQDTPECEQKQTFLKSVGNFKKGHYILISSKIEGIEKIRHLESLAYIPWIAIFDFDPNSKSSGLLSCLHENISKIRSLREYTFNEITKSINDTSTSWVYMKGCIEHPDTLLQSRKQEKRKFLTTLLELLEKFAEENSPKFTILVFWPTDVSLSQEFLDMLILIDGYLNVSIMLVDEYPHEGDIKSSHLTFLQQRSNVSKTELRVSEICKLIHLQFSSKLSPIRSSHKLPTEDLSSESGISNDQAMWLQECLDVLYIDNQTGIEHAVDELKEIEDNFYKGGSLPWSWWYAARAGYADIERDIMEDIVRHIQHSYIDVGQEGIVTLYHAPGSGGTCLAQRILWEFKNKIPCAQIKKCTGSYDDIVERIHFLRNCTKMPLLLLVDGEDAQYVKTLRHFLQCSCVIFLDVKRYHHRMEQEDLMSKKGMFFLEDIVTFSESRQIMLRYGKHCNEQQFQRVIELSDDIKQGTRHSIFDFGLAVHSFKYKGIPSYVKAHLDLDNTKSKLKPWQKALAYLSLAYYYGQSAVPCYFLKDILEREDDVIDMHDLPPEMQSLIVDDTYNKKSCVVRISHHCVALAIIDQTLGNPNPKDYVPSNTLSAMAKTQLGKFAVEFIQAMGRIGTGYAICEIMKRTFISRDNIVIGERETQSKPSQKPHFAPLLEDASPSKPYTERFNILIALTKSFPQNAQFRAHLGRLYCKCKSQDEKSAERCFEEAVEIALCEVSGISSERYPYTIRCDLNRIYHMYGTMFASRIKKYVDQLRRHKSNKSDIELKAKELLPTVKDACNYFVKCREMLPMGHEETFAYIAEIQVRLDFCVIVDIAVGNLISWTESLKNDDVSEFVSECFVKLDDLILECFTVTEAEDRDKNGILYCLEMFSKLFHSLPGKRENDSFGDIQKRRREIAKIRLKHCTRETYGVTQKIINSAEISFIVTAYEQNFDDYKAQAGLVSKGAMNRDYKEWLCAIRHGKFSKNYTIEDVLVTVEKWVTQLDSIDAKFYRFILKSVLGFGSQDHPGHTELLEVAQSEKKNLLKLSKDVYRPNYPREWLARCPDSKLIRRLKWVKRFFGQIEGKQISHEDTSTEDLEIMTGTIKPQNDKRLEGFISLDLGPHNTVPVDVFFIPAKTKLQGKQNAHHKVQFYLGFSIAHGYEAYNVEEISKARCTECKFQVLIRKCDTQAHCPRCKIKTNVQYLE